MIKVRFCRAGNFKDGYFRSLNYKHKGQFTLTFESVEDLVGWYKRQYIRMSRLKESSKEYNAKTNFLPITPVCLSEDLSKEELKNFERKIRVAAKKYFWRCHDIL